MIPSAITNSLYRETKDLAQDASAPPGELERARRLLATIIANGEGSGFAPGSELPPSDAMNPANQQAWQACDQAVKSTGHDPVPGNVCIFDDQQLTAARANPVLKDLLAKPPNLTVGPMRANGALRFLHFYQATSGMATGRYPRDAEHPVVPPKAIAALGRLQPPSRLFGTFVFTMLVAIFIALAVWVFRKSGATPRLDPTYPWIYLTVLLAVFFAFAGWLIGGRLDSVLIDSRNRISLSNLQLVGWTVVILGGYFTLAMWNLGGNGIADPFPTMQQYLWGLMGIAFVSPMASGVMLQLKTSNPVDDTAAAANPPKAVDPSQVDNHGSVDIRSDPSAAQWTDLFIGEEVANRNSVDISRVQNFFITLILLVTYLTMLAGTIGKLATTGASVATGMPEPGPTFIGLLGVSHAAYLVMKGLPKSVPPADG